MTVTQTIPSPYLWHSDDPTLVPFSIYRDEGVFRQEQEQIFKGKVWHYLALECEIKQPFDFVTTYVGLVPVVVNRDRNGEVRAFVNQCAHRGAAVVREVRGNAKVHTCIYHQWAYDQSGSLIGLPYRRGIKGVGGFPQDFKLEEHCMRRLRISIVQGIIFGTLSEDTKPIEEFLGEEILARLARIFHKPIKVIGYQRQHIRANWKLMVENVKDSYHGPLLHAFDSKFGIFRASQKGEVTIAGNGVHSMLSTYETQDESISSALEGVSTFRPDLKLNDEEMVKRVPEFEEGALTSIVSIFPSFLMLHTLNFIGFRHVRPKATGEFEMVWTYLGYTDDDQEMEDLRLKQLNLFGAGGYVSMEDAHALEIVQSTVEGEHGDGYGVVALDGDGTETVHHLVTETAIRSFWKGYREIMGFNNTKEEVGKEGVRNEY